MKSRSKTKSVEKTQVDTTQAESSENISQIDGSQGMISDLRESDVFVPAVFGCLVASMYSLSILSPTIWGGGLVYVPGFFTGIAASMMYTGGTKNWIIGGLSGLVSALPLLVAIVELHVSVGVTASLFGSVLLSILSATILGIVGSYVYSYFD